MTNTEICLPLAEALAEALDVMACVSALPADPAMALGPPAQPVCVRIAFSGSPGGGAAPGAMELMAPAALGAVMAAGMLGTTPEHPDARVRGDDVLKELMNVACGVLLRGSGGHVQMALPELRPADEGEWDAFRATAGACELEAEGLPLCVRLEGGKT